MSCGVGRGCKSDLVWLWLWCRLAAAAPILPLAWEPPYAAPAALKRQKKEKGKRGKYSTLGSFRVQPPVGFAVDPVRLRSRFPVASVRSLVLSTAGLDGVTAPGLAPGGLVCRSDSGSFPSTTCGYAPPAPPV